MPDPDVKWPEDVQPQWFNLIRRLQSVAKQGNQGLAIIRISVLVDSEGHPISWVEPTRILLEPKRKAEQVIELLTE